MPGRAAAPFPAKLASACLRVFYPLLHPVLTGWLGGGDGTSYAPPVSASTSVEIATKEGANALSQRSVLMKEPPECLTDSVDLGPKSCSVRMEGSSLACLSFDIGKVALELSDSVSDIFLDFGVVRFRNLLMLPGQMPFHLGCLIINIRQFREIVDLFIPHSRHCLC